MKRIEFIAPVEAMRGNLSGAQKLEYPTDNLGAYEGPMGAVNYARNYSPRFVGAKIAKSGKKYFSVRLRTANHLTAKSKKAMALLGGTGAIYAAILKNASLLAGIQAQYNALVAVGLQKSFRKYVTDVIRQGLIEKAAQFTFSGPESPVNVANPWVNTSANPNIEVSDAILVKFWSELTNGTPAIIVVNNMQIPCHQGELFTNVIVQGQHAFEADGTHIKFRLDQKYLINGAVDPVYYVTTSDVIDNGSVYETTAEQPE